MQNTCQTSFKKTYGKLSTVYKSPNGLTANGVNANRMEIGCVRELHGGSERTKPGCLKHRLLSCRASRGLHSPALQEPKEHGLLDSPSDSPWLIRPSWTSQRPHPGSSAHFERRSAL